MFGFGKKKEEEYPDITSEDILGEVKKTTIPNKMEDIPDEELPPLPPLPKPKEPEMNVIPDLMPTPEEKKEEIREETPRIIESNNIPEIPIKEKEPKEEVKLPPKPEFEDNIPVQSSNPTFFIRIDKYKEVINSTANARGLVGEILNDLDDLEKLKEKEQETINSMKQVMKEASNRLDSMKATFKEPL